MDNQETNDHHPNKLNERRSSLEVEYSEIHNFLRYLLDYRAKIFNFAMVFNAALLTLVFAHIKDDHTFGRLLLTILGLGASSVFLLAEKRTIFVFYQYLTYAKNVEIKLGIGVLSSVRTKVENDKISLRRCFQSLYILMIVIWIFVFMSFLPKILSRLFY